MAVNMCPTDGLQSFPVDVGFALTESSYTDAKNTPLNIQFNWGTRTNTPIFSSAGSGVIDHVENDVSTSLTYKDQLYNLGSLQLTSPTHNRWIVSSDSSTSKTSNKEDIVITYELDTFAKSKNTDPKYIILVSPLIRTDDSVDDPNYLINLAYGSASNETLEQLFPYNYGNNYVYYTTCVPGNTLRSHYRNILVLLNTSGISVSTNLMNQIKGKYNSFSKGDYPQYVPLGNFSVKSSIISRVTGLTTMEGFQSTVASVTNPPAPSTTSSGSNPSTNITSYNSMKCVPFDPEKNLTKNGAIVIDTSTGVPFSLDPNTTPSMMRSVLGAIKDSNGNLLYPNAAGLSDDDARNKYLQILPDTARNNSKNKFILSHDGVIPFSSIEKTFIGFCAVVMIVVFILIFFSLTAKMKDDSNSNLWWLFSNFSLNLVLFIGGFFIGYFTIPANCPPTTSTDSSDSSGSSGSN